MTRKKKSIILALACAVITAGALLMTLIVLPILHENECRNRVFEDLEARLPQVRSGVIGIIPKTTGSDGSVTYGGGGSGVVFSRDEKEKDLYYAVTAAHVVSGRDAEYKTFTVNTPYTAEDDPALKAAGVEVVSSSFYESLTDLKIEYVSPKIDAAVVSFRSETELACPGWAPDVTEGQRIVTLGFPEGRFISESYGTVSGHQTKKIRSADGTEKADTVVEHDAFLDPGSSGGPVFNESMALCGMNIGGEFDRWDHFEAGFMLDTPQLQSCIDEWKASR
ncbi:MAG: trypsin-like peptidase domain-containing protein [Ruminococcus sp.]|nr:trypsin-like peptidase domain-containing protein [Ruminococcus sp.]